MEVESNNPILIETSPNERKEMENGSNLNNGVNEGMIEEKPKLLSFEETLQINPPVRAIICGKKRNEEVETPMESVDKNYVPACIKKIGMVMKVVEGKSLVQGGYGVVENGTLLYSIDKKCIGKVEDVFGQITEPFYVFDGIIQVGEDVFVEDAQKIFIDVNSVSRYGTDASGKDDMELAENDLHDFSDDEEERVWKQKRKLRGHPTEMIEPPVEMPTFGEEYLD